jgi:hypothetical protein
MRHDEMKEVRAGLYQLPSLLRDLLSSRTVHSLRSLDANLATQQKQMLWLADKQSQICTALLLLQAGLRLIELDSSIKGLQWVPRSRTASRET